MSAIEVSKLPDMPSAPAFVKKRRRNLDFDQRAAAIITGRKLCTSGRKRIRPDQWGRFVELIGTTCIRQICQRQDMPSEAAVYKKRKLDPQFDRLFAEKFRECRAVAIQARLHSRFPGMARLRDLSQDVGWSIYESPQRLVSFQEQLADNDLYSAAFAAVPIHINSNDRADIVADLVLAVLEGQFTATEIATNSKKFQRQHWKMFGTIGRTSLDAPRFSDGPATLGDTIRSDTFHF